jgi:hypothetical protein
MLPARAGADERTARVAENASLLPDVRPDRLHAAVDAAFSTETPSIPAELLLSIAWLESRMEPATAVGRVCGVMQVDPYTIGQPRSICALWARDVRAAFAAGVLELEIMLRDRRVMGDMRLALLYRACGNSAFDGSCRKTRYPGIVLRRAGWLRWSLHGRERTVTPRDRS